jgi:hypothetical protein
VLEPLVLTHGDVLHLGRSRLRMDLGGAPSTVTPSRGMIEPPDQTD